jgi:hypothetical protein
MAWMSFYSMPASLKNIAVMLTSLVVNVCNYEILVSSSVLAKKLRRSFCEYRPYPKKGLKKDCNCAHFSSEIIESGNAI